MLRYIPTITIKPDQTYLQPQVWLSTNSQTKKHSYSSNLSVKEYVLIHSVKLVNNIEIRLITKIISNIALTLVIYSWNRVPGPSFKIYYLVPNLGNEYPVFSHDRKKYHQFLASVCIYSSVSSNILKHFWLYKVLRLISSSIICLLRSALKLCCLLKIIV